MSISSRPLRRLLHAGVLIVICAALQGVVFAQQTGEITGNVGDSTKAVIPGARVIATNSATGQERTSTTTDGGTYTIPSLQPGVYDVRVEKDGFTAVRQQGIDVRVGSATRLDFELAPGSVSQTVEVTTGSPLLNAENTSLGIVVDAKQITQLPLNGRDYLSLVGLGPNVVAETQISGNQGGGTGFQGGVRSTESISVAGQRLELNHYTLDGVENTDPNWNSYIVHPSVDAIHEFKVLTGVYPAEFGQGASQINVATLSGGNIYHLTAFEFIRNSAVDAKTWRQIGHKNPFKRNQYGFTLSGPVLPAKWAGDHQRLFFMSNFEGDHDRLTQQFTASVPTTAMRNGDLSYFYCAQGQTQTAAGGICHNVYDPTTRVFTSSTTGTAKQYPGNIIPKASISQQGLNILNYVPLPNVCDVGLTCGSSAFNYVNQLSVPTDSTNFTQRVDFNQTDKTSWFARFSWGSDFATVSQDPFIFDQVQIPTTVYQAVLANTHTFSPSAVNEARITWSKFLNNNAGYYSNKTDVLSTLGIAGLSSPDPVGWGLPQISLGAGFSNFGNNGAWSLADNLYHANDSFSLLRGKHSMKFGGEFGRDQFDQVGNQFASGSFTFDGVSTNNPGISGTGLTFGDLLTGYPGISVRVIAFSNIQLRRSDYAAFAQDDWKMTPKLTVNGGLRYENYRPWVDKHDNLINPQVFTTGVTTGPWLGYGQTPVSTLNSSIAQPILTRPGSGDFYDGLGFRYSTGANVQRGDQYLGRAMTGASNLNWGPRLGISYSFTNKTVVRTGYGIFFAHDIGYPWFDMGRNLGGRDTLNLATNNRTATLVSPWASEANPANCPGWSGPCLVKPQIQAVSAGNKASYVQQYMLNVQQQFTSTMALELGYLGSIGTKLGRELLVNQAVPKTGPSDTSTIAQRSPFPNYGVFQTAVNNVKSSYNALSAKLTQDLSHGLTYSAAFTWSRAIDDGSSVRANGNDYFIPSNSYNLRGERGPSVFNLPLRFVASYNYTLPFGPGQKYANSGLKSQLIGGWQLGGIITLADGLPAYWIKLGDTANINATQGNMPDSTGVSPIPINRSANKFWNIAAADYTNSALNWRPGTMGRGTLTTPGYKNFDTSIIRNFRITERQNLNIRFESFNTFNHPNWNVPSSDGRNSATFGVITSAKTMRQLQLAAKYSF
jgi:hypothetical protein